MARQAHLARGIQGAGIRLWYNLSQSTSALSFAAESFIHISQRNPHETPKDNLHAQPVMAEDISGSVDHVAESFGDVAR